MQAPRDTNASSENPVQVDPNSNAARYTWSAPELNGQTDAGGDGRWRFNPIRLGFVGVGGMGSHTLGKLMDDPRVRIVAICDCDSSVLEKVQAKLEAAGKADGLLACGDFRDLNRSEQVEAVIISTPDHWHALQAIDAMRAGKDVYVEKPLTLTVQEGRWVTRMEKETGRICQTGTQQRSSAEFRRAAELVRNGYLGHIQEVQVRLPLNNRTCDRNWEPMTVPESLDYDMWIGPAQMKPYHNDRCHYTFRFVSDYSGGQMTNWGAHHLDIVQWALGTDDTGPVKVSGHGLFPESGIFDVAEQIDVTWEYASGTRVRAVMGKPATVTFMGEKGELVVKRRNIEATPPELLETKLKDGDQRLYVSDDHLGNFFECVRTRETPICPAEVGHRSATMCHIGNIAAKLGRELAWDPITETFDDPEANAMLARPVRAPWDELVPA